jgi:hypothetical protein
MQLPFAMKRLAASAVETAIPGYRQERKNDT